MSTADAIADRLRSRLLADLHADRIDPADRLPSIRAMAEDLGADHRTVARAYRTLEAEGLVEIRERSGVFVAPQDHLGRHRTMLAETAEWLAGVAAGAWTRRIPLPDLADLFSSCLAPDRIRCVLAESMEDVRVLWARELKEDFGFDVETVRLSSGPDSLPPDEAERFRAALEGVDFVVTSVYHGQAVESEAKEVGVPFAIVRYDARWVDEVRRRVEEAPSATLVLLDPEKGARRVAPIEAADRLRVVGVEEWDRDRTGDSPVWCSPAVAERLGDDAPDVLGLPGPALSADSVRTLCEMIVRANLEREDGGCIEP